MTETADGPIVTGYTLEESAALIDAAYAYVEDLLFHKTGQRWIGTCNVAWLRPCPPCTCHGSCECGFYQRIDIYQALDCFEACEVVGYRIDGTDQALSWLVSPGVTAPKWRIENGRYLVYQVPDGCSTCGSSFPPQDLSLPIGMPCTWEIGVRYGCDPPLHVLQAVADMVAEQIKACVAPSECALPDNVESVSERGRTYKFRQPSDTNSGVWSWDQVCQLFGMPDNPKGPEGIYLPPGYTSVIRSTGGTVTTPPVPPTP